MSTPSLRRKVESALHDLAVTRDLFTTGNSFFKNALGYDTSLQTRLSNNSYAGFDAVYVRGDEAFDPDKALTSEWAVVEVLFQLTEEQMVKTIGLFSTDEIDKTIMESYLFVAIDLVGEEYSRTKLASITRQVNMLFRQPVMLLFRYGAMENKLLTLAVIDRRLHKRDQERDVLNKVTFIKDVTPADPNRAHIDILSELHQDEILYRDAKGKQRKPRNFVELHRAWRQVLSVTELNKRFYRELSDWFFWATGKGKEAFEGVDFQFHLLPEEDRDATRAQAVIRLITRVIFVWFLKEKGLVPAQLFDQHILKTSGVNFGADESAYYKAILQNLFFATLNTKVDKRGFKNERNYQGKSDEYGNPSLLRHSSLFTCDPAEMKALFAEVPFLNGGLFECLDEPKQNIWIDCFTQGKHQPKVPNELFLREEPLAVDLNEIYGTKGRLSQVRGLLTILKSYKFTIDENTPVDEEVALDPELLGKVFENLLAAYNVETKDTARRQTGSFYTPREIVNYMVEEGLVAYLEDYVLQSAPPREGQPKFDPFQMGMFGYDNTVQIQFDFDRKESANQFRKQLRDKLHRLVSFNHEDNPFSDSREIQFIVEAIDRIRILDPAVGSGAYPMGVLQLLVHVLAKIDPNNTYWEQVQQNNRAGTQVQRKEMEAVFAKGEGYARKLYLIENCIFGVDIQPVAIQICKLRFFVSLAIDEKKNDDPADNYGVKPLPNLETKFVAANSLVKLETIASTLVPVKVHDLKTELKSLRRRFFNLKTKKAKDKNRDRDQAIRQEIGKFLKAADFPVTSADRIAAWNPYDQRSSAGWFDPEWMLGESAFDLVIGNPPYRQLQKYDKQTKDTLKAQGYKTHVNTGDIYSLFYERGVELLRQRGILAYITSNNWMRAKYGDKTRKFFTTQNPLILVDFGMAQMFESATTYTNILILQKAVNEKKTRMVRVRDNFDATERDAVARYVEANASVQIRLDGNSWVAYTQTEYELKQRIVKQGEPLKKKSIWNIRNNRGIVTGKNSVFVLSSQQLNTEIPDWKDDKYKEVIRKIIRGRDVRKWVPDWDDQYVLFIPWHFPLHDSNIPPRGSSINAEKELARIYPSLYRYLLKNKAELSNRNKSETGIRYEWYALQRYGANFYKDYEEKKIIYPNMTNTLPFSIDYSDRYLINQKCYIIVGDHLAYLACVFNSALYRFAFKDEFPELLGNSVELSGVFFNKIPIKPPILEQEWLFDRVAEYIITAKKTDDLGAATLLFQQLVDGLIYELYFENELRAAGIKLLPLLTRDVIPALPEGEAERVKTIERVYRTLHDPMHPIRVSLFKLNTVQEVRIIEGKDD